MFRILFLSFLFFQGLLSLFAQQPLFSKVIHMAQGYCVEKTWDQHYLVTGKRNENALVIKLNPDGSVVWSKTMGSIYSGFLSLAATHDSCFILVGYISNPGGLSDVFCVKINSDGDTLWSRSFDLGYGEEQAYSVKQTFDHGFILTGDCDMSKIFVMKLDSAGNLAWSKLFTAGSLENMATGITQTPDSGFVVTGLYENHPPPDIGMFLLKLSASGEILWGKRQVSAPQYVANGYDVGIVEDGIMSYFNAGYEGPVLMKTDFAGNFLWARSYPLFWDSNLGPKPRLRQTSDDGFVFTYGSEFMAGGLVKVDSTGDPLWQQELFMAPMDAVESFDNGYLVIGNGPLIGVKKEPAYFDQQIGIIKTDSLGIMILCGGTRSVVVNPFFAELQPVVFTSLSAGNLSHINVPVSDILQTADSGCVDVSGAIPESQNKVGSVNISPNPTAGKFVVTASGFSGQEIKTISVYNVLGGEIFRSSDVAVTDAAIDLRLVPDGVYFVKVSYGGLVFTRKVIICH
ncbi:MAG: T9SS type A sorting domain-containing protein [Bacteroidota bacterium]